MSSAGKKLQDIFDAGSSKLQELERSQMTALKSTTDGHLKDSKGASGAAAEQSKKQGKELQELLEAHLSKTIQKIQKTIENESQETSKHMKLVLDKVAILSKKLQDSIDELRDTHEYTISTLAEDSCDRYEREFEATNADVRKQDYESSQNLKVQDRFVMNSFQQKLDHSLVETRGEERQISSKLFKAFLQNSNSIDAHVASLGQKLSQDYQSHADELAARAKEAEEELQHHLEHLVSEADRHALDVEQKTHEIFERVSFDTASGADQGFESVTQDLSSLHEQSCAELSTVLADAEADLQKVSASAQESLRKSSQESCNTADTALESFTKESQRRLDSSVDSQRELQNHREQIIGQIKNGLKDLAGKFEQRVTEAEQKALQELSSVSREAEDSIIEGQQSSVSQMQEIAGAARTQIDSALKQFLSRLQEKRNAAVDEVMRAAGSNMPNPAPAESQSEPKKSGRKGKKADADKESDEESSSAKGD